MRPDCASVPRVLHSTLRYGCRLSSFSLAAYCFKRKSPAGIHGSSQRGAMFGLDARLALAIFGMLAVVAGVVSFGRIGLAKQTALIAELQAFEHALMQYQHDMGTFYLFTLDKPIDDTNSAEDLEALWDESKVKPNFRKNWHGPYLARENRRSREYGSFGVFYAQADRQNYCTAQSECAIWLTLSRVPAPRWNEINRIVDEAGGKVPEPIGEQTSSGRVQSDTSSDPRVLLYRIEGREKQ
jgi:type II secretory pathway pseudopilin PulG